MTDNNQEIVLRWQPDGKEWVQALTAFIQRQMLRSPRTWVVFGIGNLAILGAIALRLKTGTIPIPVAALVLFGLLGMDGLWLGMMPRSTARKRWKCNPRMHQPQEVVLMATEALWKGQDCEGKWRWSAFDKVDEFGACYGLHITGQRSPAMVLMIPKRAMPGPGGAERLGELLRERVAAAQASTAASSL